MTYSEALTTFEHLFNNNMDFDAMQDLLIKLYDRGETAQEIAAAASVMREHSIKLPIPEHLEHQLIDNCGTGGDKSGSFNISTTVSIVLAAAGCYVAKHGNRSITSKSGSADVLETLNINLHLTPHNQVEMLEETGFTFMFAQNHHPAMKFIMPVRKSIEHRTIFNILGPLTNPAGVNKQLIGVFDKEYISRVAKALELNNAQKAMVVSSKDGMDEIGISTVSYAATLDKGNIQDIVIDPEAFGLKLAPSEAILGGDATHNAAIMQGVLMNKIDDAKRDIVLLNTAAALWVDGKASDMQQGLEIARDVIDSGKAQTQLEKIIRISNLLA